MLGAQVAVAVAYSRAAARECATLPGEKGELSGAYRLHGLGRKPEIPRSELAGVRHDLRSLACEIGSIGERPARSAPEEAHEVGCHPIEIHSAHRAARNRMVEHPMAGQAAHLHQPVHGRPTAAERKSPVTRSAQGDHAQIDTGGEAPIQSQLAAASTLATRERAVVHPALTGGLLELVGVGTRQEHPREVSLDNSEPPGVARIVARIAQEREHLARRLTRARG
ncbi:MAG TPA: hypothetical protein VMU67_05535 [Steroidobacteraceae bacterium]|nr:hypothetical protein [Steroidobacteraceae bacterium]